MRPAHYDEDSRVSLEQVDDTVILTIRCDDVEQADKLYHYVMSQLLENKKLVLDIRMAEEPGR